MVVVLVLNWSRTGNCQYALCHFCDDGQQLVAVFCSHPESGLFQCVILCGGRGGLAECIARNDLNASKQSIETQCFIKNGLLLAPRLMNSSCKITKVPPHSHSGASFSAPRI